MMKSKYFIGIFALLVPLNFVEARSLKHIKVSKKLIAATNGTFAPFSFYQNAKLTGFEVDLVEALAQDLGLSVVWKIVPFENTLIGLQQNRYDLVIASHGITPERLKTVDFSAPHYCSSAVIMSRKGGPLKTKDLKNKTLGAQVGTTYLGYLESVEGRGEIKTFKSETDTILALSSGRVDVMIGDKLAALALLKARPDLKLQMGEALFVEQIAMAIQKNNDSLLNAINASLSKLLHSGEYSKISQKYFGEDIRCMPSEQPKAKK